MSAWPVAAAPSPRACGACCLLRHCALDASGCKPSGDVLSNSPFLQLKHGAWEFKIAHHTEISKT